MTRLLLLVALLVAGYAPLAGSTTKNVDVTVTPGDTTPSSADEEFVGPFASWACSRTLASGTCGNAGVNASYGTAVGNDSTDDTTALQNAINGLSASNPVLYLAPGTYKITSTLTVSSGMSVCSGTGVCKQIAIVGHDPSDTIIKWYGTAGGTMFRVNGVSYSAFNRITFDGRSLAGVLVDQSWDGSGAGGKVFDTNNQYADDVFKNGGTNGIGYRCGQLNNGCSEVEIVRSEFNTLTFGAVTCNANALDVWVWYSKFINNDYGISNNTVTLVPATASCGGGNYHAANNIFQNSAVGDFAGLSGGQFNIIDNYSSGSAKFVVVHGSNLTMQRNTIIDTDDSKSVQACVSVVMLDNKIRTLGGNTAPVVYGLGVAPPGTTTYCEGGKILSLGNTFTVSSAEDHYNTFYQNGDIVDAGGTTINATVPTLPGTPANNGRTVYETSSGGSGTTCSAASPCSVQTAICLAATGTSGFSGGNCAGTVATGRKVVHLTPGTYNVAATLVVPANSDIQIIGDGWWTVLSGNSGVDPVLKINGPSHVVMRNFMTMTSTASADAILMSGVDQAGATVHIEDSLLAGDNSTAGSRAIFLDALSNVYVEAHGLNFPYTTLPAIRQTGPAPFNIFFGATSGFSLANNAMATLSGGAKLQMVGVWQDGMGGSSTVPGISATGGGQVVFSTANYNLQTSTSVKALDLPNYTGTAIMLNLDIEGDSTNGQMTFTGASSSGGKEIIAFNSGRAATFVSNTATGNTVEVLGNNNQADVPGSPDLTVVDAAMQLFRSTRPFPATATVAGVTGIEIYRLFATSAAGNAVHVTQ